MSVTLEAPAYPRPAPRSVPVSAVSPRTRLILYSLLLATVAGFTCFYRLGDASVIVNGDEAAYALVLDNMITSGDWISPTIQPPRPHLNKPPLYYWLSALTYHLFEDGLWRYRIWSAGFAVAAVLLTGYLGARLFNPEAGLLAGLMLATNSNFLFNHGARTGAFDAAITFCVVAGLCCYVGSWAKSRPWLHWSGLGVVAGAACLFKHPVFGMMLLGLIGLHHVVRRCDLVWPKRLASPLLALAIMTALAAPWHLAQWLRWGDSFIEHYFSKNVVTRATTGLHHEHVRSNAYYLESIFFSSRSFTLVWPAVVVSLIACCVGPRRREMRALCLFALAFLLVFSLSNNKLEHYAFPIYPLLALMTSACAVLLIPGWLQGLHLTRFARIAAVASALALAFLILGDLKNHPRRLQRSDINVPFVLHEHFRAALHSDDLRLVLYRFHDNNRSNAGQVGYVNCARLFAGRMPLALNADSPADLHALIMDDVPTLVLMWPDNPSAEILASCPVAPDAPQAATLGARRPYRALSFHGALDRLKAEGVPGLHIAEQLNRVARQPG